MRRAVGAEHMFRPFFCLTRGAVSLLLMAMLFTTVLAPDLAADEARERLVIETANGPRTFMVEVARTERQKALGLMFRTRVPEGTGMLFPYSRPQIITMWMRNTYVSLDMIFIGANQKIVRIAEATEPMSEEIVSSERPAVAVLEIAAGQARQLGIKPGQAVVSASLSPAQ